MKLPDVSISVQTTPKRATGTSPDLFAEFTPSGPTTAQLIEGGMVVRRLPQLIEDGALTCRARDEALPLEEHGDNDGFCAHCNSEIEL